MHKLVSPRNIGVLYRAIHRRFLKFEERAKKRLVVERTRDEERHAGTYFFVLMRSRYLTLCGIER